ncbi:MAG: coenzyme F430 synthase [Methanobrevibacter sp.]|uniref:coenzyme F430 synthase n=1 Tax=Methanobrevibacter sp. TaxID=66852 RepID=UPI0025F9A25B|nr:coenzyme F430 synthase [Methanobrevibacter sp.]MBQ6099303.1 coenzyme F430 synthase [Methanobrevibacter sp.]
MNRLVIDLTHGGVKIAVSLAKKGKSVLAYDIYNTLGDIDRQMLEIYGVELIDLKDLSEFKGDMEVIYPVHLPLTADEIASNNPDLNYTFKTHHEAVYDLLSDWGDDIPKIEITGVKGKTSSAFMLKEILIDENPLVLSSLGAILYENKKEIVLKRNISITPANIKETVDLAYKVANPVCLIAEGKVKSENLKKYSSAIFESSLGASAIGDVGLLTNIVENYPIAQNKSNAAEAKRQIFRCGIVVCDKKSLDEYYTDITHPKVNSFSLTDNTSNLYVENVKYSLDLTEIVMKYQNVKTKSGEISDGEISLKTFAPGPHHVSNVLGVVLTALSLNVPHEKIVSGLANFKGITGRTNKRSKGNSTIIEEINPGINTEAIRQSIEMIKNTDDYYIAVGGDYGITCEEIDEDKVSKYLDTINSQIILTGDVGRSIADKMTRNVEYIENYADVYDKAINDDKNLLFIYRSNYSKLSQR